MKIKTINYRNREIEIFQDKDAESPDEFGNDDAFLVYDHRDFTVKRKEFEPDDIFEAMQQNKKTYSGYYFFPVYAYIHSGVSLSLGRSEYPFTCRWDTSFKGFALVKREKGWSYTKDKAHKIAECIVKEWNQYLGGEVYGYSSPSSSCWGFYGDDGMEQMIEEAKSEIDHDIKEENEKHFKLLKEWIKNKVNIIYRKPLTV